MSRTHLIGHTLTRGLHQLGDNARYRLVKDPSEPSKPARGKLGIMLGAVHCSFKREIKPYQKFEMWSRILAWDRKWIYIVTHFVESDAVRPRCWSGGGVRYGPTRKHEGKPDEWQKRIFATAVSKYVLKVGRLTVHPAVALEASGLLPERPGGWLGEDSDGAALNGELKSPLPTGNEAPKSDWTWRDTEFKLQQGLHYARNFASLDELHSHFDGGEHGALGRFAIG